jgi:acetyl-CoA carboxylase biotin carboxyl carrier protein
MDVALLKDIVRLMSDNDLNTVDLREGDCRIVLRKGPAYAHSTPMAQPAPPPAGSNPAPFSTMASATAPAKPTDASPTAPDDEAGLVPIKSPMVGTFYAASSPDAKPFVSVGSVVDEDTDVCIIEAMKVFNNIKAETRGTVAKILATNGQTVEYGQVLFLVKP